MLIERVEAIILDFPFQYGAKNTDFIGPAPWRHLSTLLVTVDTDDGVTGWGEAFSYSCAEAVKAAVDHLVAPTVLGRNAADIAGITQHCQQALHLFGRYGITLFAISGLEIALWDIAGKAAGKPLHVLLGGAWRERIPAYASLLRYGDPELVAEHCKRAQAAGYEAVKLHEITEDAVRAARQALGDGVPLMIDVNCPWSPQQAITMANVFKTYDPTWLEEPVFPPEDHVGLARVRSTSGVPIAAGENHCTAFQFRDMFAAGAVDYAQPSVTKVGGVGELMKVATLAEAAAVSLMPHSPYFGPGWLATLHLMAAIPGSGYIERFYGTVEASTSGPWIDPQNGALAVPTGVGLGHDPSPELVREYQRQTP